MREMPQSELLEFVKWGVKPDDNGTLRWKIDPAVRNLPRKGSSARPLDMWVRDHGRVEAVVAELRTFLTRKPV